MQLSIYKSIVASGWFSLFAWESWEARILALARVSCLFATLPGSASRLDFVADITGFCFAWFLLLFSLLNRFFSGIWAESVIRLAWLGDTEPCSCIILFLFGSDMENVPSALCTRLVLSSTLRLTRSWWIPFPWVLSIYSISLSSDGLVYWGLSSSVRSVPSSDPISSKARQLSSPWPFSRSFTPTSGS